MDSGVSTSGLPEKSYVASSSATLGRQKTYCALAFPLVFSSVADRCFFMTWVGTAGRAPSVLRIWAKWWCRAGHPPSAEEGAPHADHPGCTPPVQVVPHTRPPEATSPTVGPS